MKTEHLVKIWKEVALGDEAYFTILGSGIQQFTGKKEYLSTESIKGTKIEKIECQITYADRPSRANMQPVINSVWFAKMQATLKVYTFTKANAQEINQYVLSTGFTGIELSNQNISPKYVRLYFVTDKFNSEKDKLCTGSTQKGVNNSFIAKLKIPIPFLSDGTPDLKEQERIVEILEKAELLKQKGKNAGGMLDEYLKSVFYELFYNKGFKTKKLKEFIAAGDTISYGIVQPGEEYDGGVPTLRPVDIIDGELILKDVKRVDPTISKKFKRTNLNGGEVLITVRGTTGDVVIAPPECTGFNVTRGIAVIRPLEIIRSYLKFYLTSVIGSNYIQKHTKGATLKQINLSDLDKMDILFPPLPIQQKFAKIVEYVEELKENVKKIKQNSEELFNSLMQKAFRGEL